MPATLNIQDQYRCDSCRWAADIHGRNCAHGMLFPLLLIMGGYESCPNYKFDQTKVEEQLKHQQS